MMTRKPQTGDTLLILDGAYTGSVVKVLATHYHNPELYDIFVYINDAFIGFDVNLSNTALHRRWSAAEFGFLIIGTTPN